MSRASRRRRGALWPSLRRERFSYFPLSRHHHQGCLLSNTSLFVLLAMHTFPFHNQTFKLSTLSSIDFFLVVHSCSSTSTFSYLPYNHTFFFSLHHRPLSALTPSASLKLKSFFVNRTASFHPICINNTSLCLCLFPISGL